MKTLAAYFQSKRTYLEEQFKGEITIEQLIAIIYDIIAEVSDINGEYISELTIPQARIAERLLGIVSSTLRSMMNNQGVVSSGVVQTGLEQHGIYSHGTIGKDAIAGTLVGTVVAAYLKGVVGLIIGVMGGTLTAYLVKHGSSDTELIDRTSAVIRVQHEEYDPVPMLSNIEQLFESLDSGIAEFGTISGPQQSRMEIPLELLEFLQNLMGESRQAGDSIPSVIKDRLIQIKTILRRSGLRVESYPTQKDPSGKLDEFFMFEPGSDTKITVYQTLLPAIFQGDKLILPGRVSEPKIVGS
jgi:hypothetical protein